MNLVKMEVWESRDAVYHVHETVSVAYRYSTLLCCGYDTLTLSESNSFVIRPQFSLHAHLGLDRFYIIVLNK